MKKQLALALTLAIAPLIASASDLGYTYLEGGYAQYRDDVDPDSDIEASGIFVGGSLEFADSFHAFGAYRTGDDDAPGPFGGNVNVDFSRFEIGLGYHHGLSSTADLLAEVSYLSSEVEFGNVSVDGDDVRLAVGARAQLADPFDGWIKGHYSDGDFYDGEFGVSVGAQYRFTRTWGVMAEAEFIDDRNLLSIGARANF